MQIRKDIPLPIVVIWGINKENAVQFIDIGIDGLSVVSAIISQADIRKAAIELKHIFQGGAGVNEF